MKIIGIEGSPRKNGNTEKLVRAILQGAIDDGHEAKFCKLADMKISPLPGLHRLQGNGGLRHQG